MLSTLRNSTATEQKRIIQDALRDIMAKTCIVFVPRRSEADYISFVNRGLGGVPKPFSPQAS